MIRRLRLFAVVFAAFGSTISGVAAEDSFLWGVGLQGNAPVWGGLSVAYRGFDPILLRTVGRFSQSGDNDRSVLIGIQTPVVLGRARNYRIYIAPGVAYRTERRWDNDETTIGGAAVIGSEFYIDSWFGLQPESRFGINIEFGQGVGRVETDYFRPASTFNDPLFPYELPPDRTETRASLVAGLGFMIYF